MRHLRTPIIFALTLAVLLGFGGCGESGIYRPGGGRKHQPSRNEWRDDSHYDRDRRDNDRHDNDRNDSDQRGNNRPESPDGKTGVSRVLVYVC